MNRSIKTATVDILLKVHHGMPFFIRKFYSPVFHTLVKFRGLILPVFIIEGTEIISGKTFKLTYLGWDKKIISYWVSRMFTQSNMVKTKKWVILWNVQRFNMRNKNNCDLAIAELNSITNKLHRRTTGFVLPRWLDMVMPVDRSIQTMQKLGDIPKRINRHELTVEKRYADADLKFFYERMYKPYTVNRHRDAAVVYDYGMFRNIFKKKGSTLYFIMKDGEPIAGAIDLAHQSIVRMCSVGILDGRDDIRKLGVLGAHYFFQVLDYKERGISWVEVGKTSPLLTDGVTKFKLSIGSETIDIKKIQDDYLWLNPLSNSIALWSFLSANPFIFIEGRDYLRAMFFHPDIDNECNNFKMLYKHTACPNVKSTLVFSFNKKELNNCLNEMNSKDVESIRKCHSHKLCQAKLKCTAEFDIIAELVLNI